MSVIDLRKKPLWNDHSIGAVLLWLSSVDVLQAVIQFMKGLLFAAPSIGKLLVFPKLQQKALCQLLYGLLQSHKELLIGKIAGRPDLLKTVCHQRFRHLVQGIHFNVHQLMDDDFLDIFLIGISGV